MLASFHIKLAIRSLKARKKFSLISILSLSLAFISVLLICMWVVNELSYDRFFSKHDRLYRLTLQVKTPDGYESHFARVAQDWVLQVGDAIPEIKSTCRFAPKRHALVSIGDFKFSTERAFTADTTVFEMFDINMLEGDQSALTNPNCVLLSQSMSEKYFRFQSPVGEYISLIGQNEDVQKQYLITGVYKDFPATTHFYPEMLLSFEDPNSYGWSYFYLYLHKNTDIATLQSKLDAYILEKADPEQAANYSLHLQNIADIHLYSHKDREIELNGNIQSVYILSGIAFMILLLALFNYINLNVAQLFREIRFLVINKIYGASVKSIFQYQLIKSTITAFLSVLFSAFLFIVLLPLLNEKLNFSLSTSNRGTLILLSTLSLLFLVAILVGTIPAFQFIASRFNSRMVTRSSNLIRLFHPHKKFLLRKILIGIQFCISTVLILATIFAVLQMNFISSKWMIGNADEDVIVIKDLGFPIREKYVEFRNDLLKSPYIVDVTAMMEVPPSPIKDAMQFEADAPIENENLSIYVGPVADNFFKFYDQSIISGTDFPEYVKDQEFENYILNESAVKFLGWTDPGEAIGKSFKLNFHAEGFIFGGKVCGVVEDFHQTSLHHPIDPTVYFQQPAFLMSFLIKVKNENSKAALLEIEETWNKLIPDYPFVYTFQKQLYNKAYAKDIIQTRLSVLFTILAIIITLIGIIGLITILTGQRTKEIGIRRVLGASINSILMHLSKEILIILIISTTLSSVIAILLVNHWLQNYVYAIIISNYWWLIVGVSIVSILITSTIIFMTVYFTSKRNPSDSLKRD